MWYSHRFFKYASALLLTLLIIFMLGQIDFFLYPFQKIMATLFIPLLVAGIAYYILRPLVSLLEKLRIPRPVSIVVAFAIVVILFFLLSTYTGSIVVKQFNQLITDLPQYYESIAQRIADLYEQDWIQSFPYINLEEKITGILESASESLSRLALGVWSTLAGIGNVFFIAPFILFYFLKDDRHFISYILKFVPQKHRGNIQEILQDIDTALSSYILGQMLVALAIGVLMLVGYLAIGLHYALVLALFAMITCIIPFFGPWIGIIPAILIALSDGPFMVIKVILVMMIVQQMDGNFISPQVVGKRLDIHPVTVFLLLMVGVTLFGFVGLLIIIPVYAAVKATVRNLHDMYGSVKLGEDG